MRDNSLSRTNSKENCKPSASKNADQCWRRSAKAIKGTKWSSFYSAVDIILFRKFNREISLGTGLYFDSWMKCVIVNSNIGWRHFKQSVTNHFLWQLSFSFYFFFVLLLLLCYLPNSQPPFVFSRGESLTRWRNYLKRFIAINIRYLILGPLILWLSYCLAVVNAKQLVILISKATFTPVGS